MAESEPRVKTVSKYDYPLLYSLLILFMMRIEEPEATPIVENPEPKIETLEEVSTPLF